MVFSDPVYTLARWFPDRPAVLLTDKVISYKALNKAIESRRAYITSCPNWAVSCVVENVFDAIVLLWACIRERKVFVPLNPKLPFSEVFRIGHDVQSFLFKSGSEEEGFECSDKDVFLTSAQPVTLVATSGSTGKPKYVVHSLGNYRMSVEASQNRIPFKSSDIWLLCVPLFHVSGLSIVFRTFFSGATLAIPNSGYLLQEAIKQFCPTHLSVVPTQLLRLPDDVDFSSLKHVLLGGAPVSDALFLRFSHLPLHLTYGLTEMTSQVVTDDRCLDSAELMLDPYTDEVLVKGKSLCLGYFDDGFIRLSLDQGGWFHTRDRGKWENGRFSILGRMDRMFISGGENIYPEAIERVALKFPGVILATVIPVPHSLYGFRPSLAYHAKEFLDFSVMTAFFKKNLPSFMCPDTIDFVSDLDLYIKKFRCK